MKPQIIALKPFPFYLAVFHGSSVKSLNKWLKKHAPEDGPETISKFCRGRTLQTTSGWYVIWLPEKAEEPSSYGYLVHEIFHVVSYLYTQVGIGHNQESGEAWAYMIQYILTSILGEKTNE